MRSNDIQDELQGGIELGAMPPVGPDGAPKLPQLRKILRPPPRLCEQGPCVHYHRFTVQLDAERPRAAAVAGPGEHHGMLVGAADAPFHTQVHHYCYPQLGIETVLGDLPIIQCNHWRPKSEEQGRLESAAGDAYLRTQAGERYLADITAWQAEHAAAESDRKADEADAQRTLAEMAAMSGGSR